ncbi:hypothetical protein [Maribacter aestuarii]|uniref:hypothetical protein n=1 Tax=Maribacter aestuarii TaxID=1130723 RepID=UPI00248BBF8D|nr:hypothetical protein [Maribacter aestuarii]
MSLGAASTVDTISGEIGGLLGLLHYDELENFACFHGNDIGRKQRCAGSHYTSVVKELKQRDKLNHIAGRFYKIHEIEDMDGLRVTYVDTASQQKIDIDKDIHLIINCMGATTLESSDAPEFLKKLISKSLVVPNKSKIGFKINSDFESSDNFFIAGPLLAGNVIDNKAMWHLEHCGRIIWSSGLLADKIMYDIVHSENSVNLKADKN